jgi:glycosyltransferase involved in cell wall biosynthesis
VAISRHAGDRAAGDALEGATSARSANGAGASPRIGILVVAFNAGATLTATLDRIPPAFRDRIAEVIVLDDASSDETVTFGRSWAARADTPKTLVIRHTKNLGYGGNQKAAYRLAITRGLDIVVLLHADGQYAPELLPRIVEPLVEGTCDAVFGSRMLEKGAARRGGMPFYKLVGNRILTRFENHLLRTRLSEFHSGYRAYSVAALREIPFEECTNDFDFDTQIIIQLVHAGKRIVEIPIPTYYGDEICYVNGLSYARNVVRDVVQYRLSAKGFGTLEWVTSPEEYAFKEGDRSSHAVLLEMLEGRQPCRILDIGCSGGLLAERLRARGHHVTGIDAIEIPGVRERTDAFFQADLSIGIPREAGTDFDVVLAGDIIEHLPRPRQTLRDVLRVLAPGGQLLLSVPNIAHWYPRTRSAFGLFGYDRRGILDDTHLRFFTRSTLRRYVQRAGFDILEERATGLPLGVLSESGDRRRRLMQNLDGMCVRARPTLFGYQFVLRLTPHAQEALVVQES